MNRRNFAQIGGASAAEWAQNQKSNPMKTESAKKEPRLKVNTATLLFEIAKIPPNQAFKKSIDTLAKLLHAVGCRATDLHDAQLDALMCDLSIYTIADLWSGDFDPNIVEEVYRAAAKSIAAEAA
jgi:hypothetical protein